MATFVLVHGAWHGGWCWKKLTPLLRSAGHDVYTPTLTGLGERVHLASTEIDLSTHIQDVVNVLEYEDLREVVLVGHSYGGMVITGAADQAASRVVHLIYLDAEVPLDGQSAYDIEKEFSVERGNPNSEPWYDEADGGWQVAVPTEAGVISMAGTADLEWVMRHLTPHPLKTATQPIHLNNTLALGIPSTYIHCTPSGPHSGTRRAQAAGWRFREIDTLHDAMVTMPRELTELLLEVV